MMPAGFPLGIGGVDADVMHHGGGRLQRLLGVRGKALRQAGEPGERMDFQQMLDALHVFFPMLHHSNEQLADTVRHDDRSFRDRGGSIVPDRGVPARGSAVA